MGCCSLGGVFMGLVASWGVQGQMVKVLENGETYLGEIWVGFLGLVVVCESEYSYKRVVVIAECARVSVTDRRMPLEPPL